MDDDDYNNTNFTDWILDLSFTVFFWLMIGAMFLFWLVAIVVLLLYLHFAYPR
jgi:hypothetical protein